MNAKVRETGRLLKQPARSILKMFAVTANILPKFSANSIKYIKSAEILLVFFLVFGYNTVRH